MTVNATAFLISGSRCLLLTDGNAIHFSCVLQPCWNHSLALEGFFLIDYMRLAVWTITSSANRNSSISPFLYVFSCPFILCPLWLELPALCWMRVSESRHPWLIPDLQEKSFQFRSIRREVRCGLLWRKWASVPTPLAVLMDRGWIHHMQRLIWCFCFSLSFDRLPWPTLKCGAISVPLE